MTLDELIDRLLQLRREFPAAGVATVVGFEIDDPEYIGGEVCFGRYDPDCCELIEMAVERVPKRTPRRHIH
jgi:hypothetical protein